jgi:hypothetical protein
LAEPVLLRWEGWHTAFFGADAFPASRWRYRLLFAGPLPGRRGRDDYVKGFLDRRPPAREGFRRGVAAVTWDLAGRVLEISFEDREGP